METHKQGIKYNNLHKKRAYCYKTNVGNIEGQYLKSKALLKNGNIYQQRFWECKF